MKLTRCILSLFVATVTGGAGCGVGVVGPGGQPSGETIDVDVKQQAATKAAADSCGDLDWFGRCSGDVAEWCSRGTRRSRDCSNYGMVCGLTTNQGYYCTESQQGCNGLNWVGRCVGDVAEWCDNDRLRRKDCAADGEVCGWTTNKGYYCKPLSNSCGGLEWSGRCVGDVAEWCAEGRIQRRDCAQYGQTCGWTTNQGYYCVDGPTNPNPNPNPGGDETFIITAVRDDLNNDDMHILAQGLESLGYSKTIEDSNVSRSELTQYIEMDVNTLYHTGHGTHGLVVTSTSSFRPSDATINVTNTYFATCLTLTDTSWRQAMGNRARTVMGYTNYSYDYTDETVVKKIIKELRDGRSHLQAWYLANSPISSLRDRWAAYARKGNNIVEYSARTSNTPALNIAGQQTREISGIQVAERLLATPTDYRSAYASMISVTESAGVDSFVQEGGFDLLVAAEVSDTEAVEMAQYWIEVFHGMPEDAILDDVIAIEIRHSDSEAYQTVAFVVSYVRQIDGLQVRGNRTEDHITALVTATNVVASSRFWPEVATAQADYAGMETLPVADAITTAASQIASLIKGEADLTVVDTAPVYGTRGTEHNGQLVPAIELQTREGYRFVVDAVTGGLLF